MTFGDPKTISGSFVELVSKRDSDRGEFSFLKIFLWLSYCREEPVQKEYIQTVHIKKDNMSNDSFLFLV